MHWKSSCFLFLLLLLLNFDLKNIHFLGQWCLLSLNILFLFPFFLLGASNFQTNSFFLSNLFFLSILSFFLSFCQFVHQISTAEQELGRQDSPAWNPIAAVSWSLRKVPAPVRSDFEDHELSTSHSTEITRIPRAFTSDWPEITKCAHFLVFDWSEIPRYGTGTSLGRLHFTPRCHWLGSGQPNKKKKNGTVRWGGGGRGGAPPPPPPRPHGRRELRAPRAFIARWRPGLLSSASSGTRRVRPGTKRGIWAADRNANKAAELLLHFEPGLTRLVMGWRKTTQKKKAPKLWSFFEGFAHLCSF